ncbi:MAG: alpha/beta hydrolase [Candidatus Gottesmanbacteria bacterium]|nr:alpha/beta hydrolase [Candidatus Gottesmanbacteria bacterium]
MKNVLILHGTEDNSTKNWFPWLKKELEKRGYKVWVPDLPHAEKPNIQRYNDYIFSRWKFDKNSIIIGHSSGAVEILGILQQLPNSVCVHKAILVAGFTTDLDWEPLSELIIPFDWQKIRSHAKKIILFHSDNDPFVPLLHGKKLEKELAAELIIMKGQKHFSLSSAPGYDKFPAVLEKILE